MDKISCRQYLRELNCCVIIPTYNNEQTLAQIITDVSEYADDIIVVDDGSTDSTPSILKEFTTIQSIGYAKNVGKGFGLRTGFKYAIEKGYDYAITIDSDGQHFAKDIPAFATKLREEPGTLIIGARNMEQSSVPGKSSFGNKFSNFWFKFETGIKSPDTQSGFRLYPLYLLKGMKFYTVKYEFEIEVLVRAAWKKVKITSVPVQVYYAPKETRISHFRPFTDFSRVTVLNVLLVVLTFIYYAPLRFLEGLKKKVLASS